MRKSLTTLKALLKRDSLRVLGVIVAVRMAVFLLSAVAYPLFNQVVDAQPILVFIADIWNQWDSRWFLAIAEWGYDAEGVRAAHVVFFPLYPLLIKLVELVVGNFFWAAIIVANVMSTAGLFMFYKLAKFEFGKNVAWWSLVALMIFPTAYIFSASYTEGPFLFLAVSSFYWARQRKWGVAGMFGCLAALTRLVGVLLFPALLIEWFLQRKESGGKDRLGLLWLLLIPGGLWVYLLLNIDLFGSPLAFVNYAGAWGKSLAMPWVGWLARWRSIGDFPFDNYDIKRHIAEVVAGALLVTSVVWGFIRIKRFRFSYTVYLVLVAFLVLSTSRLESTPRYVLSAFPLFFLLGQFGKYRGVAVVWFLLSASLMVLFLTLFISGWGGY